MGSRRHIAYSSMQKTVDHSETSEKFDLEPKYKLRILQTNNMQNWQVVTILITTMADQPWLGEWATWPYLTIIR